MGVLNTLAPDETQSSAQRPNSRLLSAEGHCVRTLNTCANLRTRSLRQAPRCDRARAAQQGAYGHKAGCELRLDQGAGCRARYERVGTEGFWITRVGPLLDTVERKRPARWSDSNVASAVLTYLDSLEAGAAPTLKGYESFRQEHAPHLPSLTSLEIRGGTKNFLQTRAELLARTTQDYAQPGPFIRRRQRAQRVGARRSSAQP
jgi:hypothetical protein